MFIILLAAALPVPASPYEMTASVNDTVALANPFPTAGPADAVSARILSPGAYTGEGPDGFWFFASREGRYAILFESRSLGSLLSDSVTVAVTDRPPRLRVAPTRDGVTAIVGRPFKLGITVEDDGPGVLLRADFDGDGRADTSCAGAGDPALRYIVPTLSGEALKVLRVRLKAVDNDGRSDTASAEVTVLFKPPLAEAGENLIACRALPCRFEGRRSRDDNGPVVSYIWDFNGDGRADTALSAPDVQWTYPNTGDFAAVLTVADKDGNRSRPDTVFASVMGGILSLSVDRDAEAAPGETVPFTGRAKTSCGEIEKYMWDFDGDGRWDATSRQHGRTEFVYDRAGEFLARFKAVSTLGDTASQIRRIRISSP